MKNASPLAILILCGAVSACATPQRATSEGPPNQETGPARFQLERYVGVDESHWSAPKNSESFADLYTQIELHADTYQTGPTPQQATSKPGTLRDYEEESRGWLGKLLSTDTQSVTTLASVQIANPELKISVPLFSISHTSGGGASETWSTDFTSSDVQSPLFLIGANTTVMIDLTDKVSSDLKSQGTAAAVNAVSTAVKIANPSAALLTTLSSSTVNSAATAIDTAISGLLSKDIGEDIQLGRQADSWDRDSQFIFYGCSPFVRFERTPPGNSICGQKPDIDHGQDALVGAWTLSLSCPRLSVFDARDICGPIGSATLLENTKYLSLAEFKPAETQIADDVKDSDVLKFPLSNQVTVSAFSLSQSWYTTFTTALANSPKPSDYGTFCAGAIAAYGANGLSRFDAEIALRAIIRTPGQFSSVQSKFATGGDGNACMVYAPSATGFQNQS